MTRIINSIILPAILTLIMELPIVLLGFRKVKCDIQYKIIIFTLINLITNLALNSISLVIRIPLTVLIVEELLIVLIEAFTYKKAFITEFKKSLLISFLANVFSGLAGTAILRITILLI